ncbi:Wadjet anti-phage system protein JetD domain-containing protein [Paenibacillus luteus]|uniref:Wadjet anti-phage system protein JetD domain-containing protein n=1 Tax=Paenibacillus luteus TaxID=2545753 RepID=UPI0011422B33|nr:Wadjet anti-phage system protein JetD domain-containing protein [Paenibacillus luteus]
MDISQTIEEHIRGMQKSTITLEELESLFVGVVIETREFATEVLALEKAKVLDAVKSAGRTTKQPEIAYRYRVNKQRLTKQHHQLLQQYRLDIHPAIQLDGYFALSVQQFEEDKPWIVFINNYLKNEGFPKEAVPAPERSFQLTGNEKWITDLGGYALLKRLGLWERLLIYPVSDPLMLAVNRTAGDKEGFNCCLHLIIENKTTFQALLPVLSGSAFHTLIYGCGNKITGNIEMLDLQYPVIDCEKRIYYFGDIDYEGIRIWYETDKRLPIRPAIPFYEACLSKPHAIGKTNQRRNEAAVQAFLGYFSPQYQEQIETCLTSGGYYPQEILTKQQLQQIWEGEQWKQWITTN